LFAETRLYVPCAVLDMTARPTEPYTPRQWKRWRHQHG
jgi:hypothetical protein